MKLSRLGIIGDVHGEAQRLDAALHFLHAADVEQILCVGDVVDGHEDAERCCELLTQNDVAVVRGNHDRWFLANQMRDLPEATQSEELSKKAKSFLRSLPKTRSFETIAGELLLCHGLGENDMGRLTPDDYGYALEVNEELQHLIRQRQFRFVANGHTHRRMVRRFEHLTVINAGTLYDDHSPCMAILDLGVSTVSFHNVVGTEIENSGQLVQLSEI